MNWRNTSARYGSLTIGLHWLMLLLIAAVYALMELSGVFPKGSAGSDAMRQWHFMLGMLVFVLAVPRLVLRWIMPSPRIEPPPPAWRRRLAGTVEALIYAVMLSLPLMGWLILSAKGSPVPFFGLELPALAGANAALARQVREAHEIVANLGLALIGLHSAAALFHHYWMHDNALLRMLPARNRP